MLNSDNAEYYRFTGPARLDKAMHTLEGLLEGITIDSRTTDQELARLTAWMGEHMEWSDRHPFNEIIPRLSEILSDRIVDEEEKADLLWLCKRLKTDEEYYCEVTSDMQRLQGVLDGISADGRISKEELRGLRDWVDEHSHLRTCWTYDELDALLTSVLKDGEIDSQEHELLLQFFGEFSRRSDHRAIAMTDSEETPLISGVCAVAPEVEFDQRTFTFTGRSKRAPRKKIASEVIRLGGTFSLNVVQAVDYLVVGADGNPCWAFACYGRKVEEAVKLRRRGFKILLVHEHDFWDAVADVG